MMNDNNQETANPIVDIMYQKLNDLTEKKIQQEFLQGRGPRVITEVIEHCIDKVLGLPEKEVQEEGDEPLGDSDQRVSTMATVLLHYLCTVLLVPTQRKTILQDNDQSITIDMVIPDTRTLRSNWNSSILLCILTSVKQDYIQQRITNAKRIQPNQENIWVVSPSVITPPIPYKTFVVVPPPSSSSSENTSFSKIILEINAFLEKNKTSRFKIFKAV